MSRDPRIFAKFTVDFPSGPKVLPLSDAAFRCLVEAICFSREHLTDGHLARCLALARWKPDVLHELCVNDDTNPSLIETETGWIIRDFLDHQESKADVEARREHAIAAGRKGGLAKAKQYAKRSAKQNASKVLSKTLSKNVAEKEKEVERGVRAHARTRATPQTPPPPCPQHGDNYDHGEPCRACQRRREYDENQQQARKHKRDEAIRKCGRCDNTGKIGLDDGTFVKCDHTTSRT